MNRTLDATLPCGYAPAGSGVYWPKPTLSNEQGFKLDIQAIRISIRQLKRNANKLRKKTSLKAKRQLERTERKLAKQIALLDEAGLATTFKKKKLNRTYKHGDYVKYIGSAEWTARKREYYETHHCECRTCGSDSKEIHLHHRTYARLFDEADADLMPLCISCHAALHFVQKSFKITVEEGTEIWVSVTNGTSQKKKIRAALRDLTIDGFKSVWRKRDRKITSPAQCLEQAMGRIVKGDLGSREDVLQDRPDLDVSAARARTTGRTGGYDRRVDAIIRRLESSR